MSEVRLLVCGGGAFADVDALADMLGQFHRKFGIDLLIEGEAPGADTLARDWAQLNGIPVKPFYAEWQLFGGRAGIIRNAKMLREAKPTHGIAFPGKRGTADMVRRMLDSNMEIILVGKWCPITSGDIIWKAHRGRQR